MYKIPRPVGQGHDPSTRIAGIPAPLAPSSKRTEASDWRGPRKVQSKKKITTIDARRKATKRVALFNDSAPVVCGSTADILLRKKAAISGVTKDTDTYTTRVERLPVLYASDVTEANKGIQAESSSNYTLPAEKSNVHHYSATANRSEPHFNNNQQSCQPPKWIQDFKNEIASLFSNQLQTLAAQIASNTSKIEYILNRLFSS
ncbi:hypothetical protein WN55_05872 [Dufourea novaeangliae]|uniref:Uncharacterized protein n=1 Tax=Dufourea novaeangliae TaxID=178035 RepID=A0A154PMT8_DUFNO|nr:hypothetical protein WN55_05872 [Dufourea novaeangliae]